MNADDGSPIHFATSHYSAKTSQSTADAPPDLSNFPTKSSGRAMGLVCQRRSTVVRRNTGSSALGQLYEESERGRSRDVGAVNVGAENVPSWAIHKFLPHARTADERGELCGLFDGNIRCGAIDPTAVRQDAAVHVGNGSNPAGHADSGATKNCGAIGDAAGRIWDEGVSGVVVDLRRAYDYWKRADDQAQLVVGSLFTWMCALEAERDPTDRFMNFGKMLLQAFRMQLMMASDPGIPLFNILARLCTAAHEC
ncbi:dynein heavy chain, putative [Trypanosoma cruzi]|nr:dynein heavy chain, putative [Trypanosoma cruzi]